MDRLSELGYSITPYRFAYNNPVYWGDPTGLLENNGENIAGCPNCPNTPKFIHFIDSKIDYEYDKELDEAVLALEGVEISGSKSKVNSSKSSAKGFFVLWGIFSNDLSGTGRGGAEHSVDVNDLPTDLFIKTANSLLNIKKAFDFILNNLQNKIDLFDRLNTVYDLYDKGNTSTMEVNNIEPVAPQEQSLYNVISWYSWPNGEPAHTMTSTDMPLERAQIDSTERANNIINENRVRKLDSVRIFKINNK